MKTLELKYEFDVSEDDLPCYFNIDGEIDSDIIEEKIEEYNGLSIEVEVTLEDIVDFQLRKNSKLSNMFFNIYLLSEEEKQHKKQLEEYYTKNVLEAWNMLNNEEFKKYIHNKYFTNFRKEAIDNLDNALDNYYGLKEFY